MESSQQREPLASRSRSRGGAGGNSTRRPRSNSGTRNTKGGVSGALVKKKSSAHRRSSAVVALAKKSRAAAAPGGRSKRRVSDFQLRNESWIERQEIAFKGLLNSILRPFADPFTSSDADEKSQFKSRNPLSTPSQKTPASASARAPVPEDSPHSRLLQLRAQEQLRRAAKTACDRELRVVIPKLMLAIRSGRFTVRSDRCLHRDVSIRNHLIDTVLLGSFNLKYLHAAFEIVYDTVIPIGYHLPAEMKGIRGLALCVASRSGGGGTAGQLRSPRKILKRFLRERLFTSPEVEEQFRGGRPQSLLKDPALGGSGSLAHGATGRRHSHLRDPSFKRGFDDTLNLFIVGRFLSLLLVMDALKSKALVPRNPCLFAPESIFKCTEDVLTHFACEYLSGEGNIVRHLKLYHYVLVAPRQTELDEYRFDVTNLRRDLRDGVRLVKLAEILTEVAVQQKVLYPATDRTRKLTNVGLAFAHFQQHSDFSLRFLPEVSRQSIVDGHRERTLSFLWALLNHFKLSKMVERSEIIEEIGYIQMFGSKYHHLSANRSFRSLKSVRSYKTKLDSSFSSHSIGDLLLIWLQSIVSNYVSPATFEVSDFVESLKDGRALCFVIHFYHDHLMPYHQICADFETSGAVDENMDPNRRTMTVAPSAGEVRSRVRKRFLLFNSAVKELGCVPYILSSTSMTGAPSNLKSSGVEGLATNFDEKIAQTFVMYLCSRLLGLSKEEHAARMIQDRWRMYRRVKRAKEEHVARSLQRRLRAASTAKDFAHKRRCATVIQRAFRRHLERSRRQLAAPSLGRRSLFEESTARAQQRRSALASPEEVPENFHAHAKECVSALAPPRGASEGADLRRNSLSTPTFLSRMVPTPKQRKSALAEASASAGASESLADTTASSASETPVEETGISLDFSELPVLDSSSFYAGSPSSFRRDSPVRMDITPPDHEATKDDGDGASVAGAAASHENPEEAQSQQLPSVGDRQHALTQTPPQGQSRLHRSETFEGGGDLSDLPQLPDTPDVSSRSRLGSMSMPTSANSPSQLMGIPDVPEVRVTPAVDESCSSAPRLQEAEECVGACPLSSLLNTAASPLDITHVSTPEQGFHGTPASLPSLPNASPPSSRSRSPMQEPTSQGAPGLFPSLPDTLAPSPSRLRAPASEQAMHDTPASLPSLPDTPASSSSVSHDPAPAGQDTPSPLPLLPDTPAAAPSWSMSGVSSISLRSDELTEGDSARVSPPKLRKFAESTPSSPHAQFSPVHFEEDTGIPLSLHVSDAFQAHAHAYESPPEPQRGDSPPVSAAVLSNPSQPGVASSRDVGTAEGPTPLSSPTFAALGQSETPSHAIASSTPVKPSRIISGSSPSVSDGALERSELAEMPKSLQKSPGDDIPTLPSSAPALDCSVLPELPNTPAKSSYGNSQGSAHQTSTCSELPPMPSSPAKSPHGDSQESPYESPMPSTPAKSPHGDSQESPYESPMPSTPAKSYYGDSQGSANESSTFSELPPMPSSPAKSPHGDSQHSANETSATEGRSELPELPNTPAKSSHDHSQGFPPESLITEDRSQLPELPNAPAKSSHDHSQRLAPQPPNTEDPSELPELPNAPAKSSHDHSQRVASQPSSTEDPSELPELPGTPETTAPGGVIEHGDSPDLTKVQPASQSSSKEATGLGSDRVVGTNLSGAQQDSRFPLGQSVDTFWPDISPSPERCQPSPSRGNGAPGTASATSMPRQMSSDGASASRSSPSPPEGDGVAAPASATSTPERPQLDISSSSATSRSRSTLGSPCGVFNGTLSPSRSPAPRSVSDLLNSVRKSFSGATPLDAPLPSNLRTPMKLEGHSVSPHETKKAHQFEDDQEVRSVAHLLQSARKSRVISSAQDTPQRSHLNFSADQHAAPPQTPLKVKQEDAIMEPTLHDALPTSTPRTSVSLSFKTPMRFNGSLSPSHTPAPPSAVELLNRGGRAAGGDTSERSTDASVTPEASAISRHGYGAKGARARLFDITPGPAPKSLAEVLKAGVRCLDTPVLQHSEKLVKFSFPVSQKKEEALKPKENPNFESGNPTRRLSESFTDAVVLPVFTDHESLTSSPEPQNEEILQASRADMSMTLNTSHPQRSRGSSGDDACDGSGTTSALSRSHSSSTDSMKDVEHSGIEGATQSQAYPTQTAALSSASSDMSLCSVAPTLGNASASPQTHVGASGTPTSIRGARPPTPATVSTIPSNTAFPPTPFTGPALQSDSASIPPTPFTGPAPQNGGASIPPTPFTQTVSQNGGASIPPTPFTGPVPQNGAASLPPTPALGRFPPPAGVPPTPFTGTMPTAGAYPSLPPTPFTEPVMHQGTPAPTLRAWHEGSSRVPANDASVAQRPASVAPAPLVKPSVGTSAIAPSSIPQGRSQMNVPTLSAENLRAAHGGGRGILNTTASTLNLSITSQAKLYDAYPTDFFKRANLHRPPARPKRAAASSPTATSSGASSSAVSSSTAATPSPSIASAPSSRLPPPPTFQPLSVSTLQRNAPKPSGNAAHPSASVVQTLPARPASQIGHKISPPFVNLQPRVSIAAQARPTLFDVPLAQTHAAAAGACGTVSAPPSTNLNVSSSTVSTLNLSQMSLSSQAHLMGAYPSGYFDRRSTHNMFPPFQQHSTRFSLASAAAARLSDANAAPPPPLRLSDAKRSLPRPVNETAQASGGSGGVNRPLPQPVKEAAEVIGGSGDATHVKKTSQPSEGNVGLAPQHPAPKSVASVPVPEVPQESVSRVPASNVPLPEVTNVAVSGRSSWRNSNSDARTQTTVPQPAVSPTPRQVQPQTDAPVEDDHIILTQSSLQDSKYASVSDGAPCSGESSKSTEGLGVGVEDTKTDPLVDQQSRSVLDRSHSLNTSMNFSELPLLDTSLASDANDAFSTRDGSSAAAAAATSPADSPIRNFNGSLSPSRTPAPRSVGDLLRSVAKRYSGGERLQHGGEKPAAPSFAEESVADRDEMRENLSSSESVEQMASNSPSRDQLHETIAQEKSGDSCSKPSTQSEISSGFHGHGSRSLNGSFLGEPSFDSDVSALPDIDSSAFHHQESFGAADTEQARETIAQNKSGDSHPKSSTPSRKPQAFHGHGSRSLNGSFLGEPSFDSDVSALPDIDGSAFHRQESFEGADIDTREVPPPNVGLPSERQPVGTQPQFDERFKMNVAKTPPREGRPSAAAAARFPSPPSLSLVNDSADTTRQSRAASSPSSNRGSLLQKDARAAAAPSQCVGPPLNTSDHAAAAGGATPTEVMNHSLDTSVVVDHRRQSVRVADFLSRSSIENFGALPRAALGPPSADKREERPESYEEESGAAAATVADLWSRSMVEQFGPLPAAASPVPAPAADEHGERPKLNDDEVGGANAATVADLWSRSMIEQFGPLPAPSEEVEANSSARNARDSLLSQPSSFNTQPMLSTSGSAADGMQGAPGGEPEGTSTTSQWRFTPWEDTSGSSATSSSPELVPSSANFTAWANPSSFSAPVPSPEVLSTFTTTPKEPKQTCGSNKPDAEDSAASQWSYTPWSAAAAGAGVGAGAGAGDAKGTSSDAQSLQHPPIGADASTALGALSSGNSQTPRGVTGPPPSRSPGAQFFAVHNRLSQPVDTSMADASMAGASALDASMADASVVDTSMPDASMADASMADASKPLSGKFSAGEPEPTEGQSSWRFTPWSDPVGAPGTRATSQKQTAPSAAPETAAKASVAPHLKFSSDFVPPCDSFTDGARMASERTQPSAHVNFVEASKSASSTESNARGGSSNSAISQENKEPNNGSTKHPSDLPEDNSTPAPWKFTPWPSTGGDSSLLASPRFDHDVSDLPNTSSVGVASSPLGGPKAAEERKPAKSVAHTDASVSSQQTSCASSSENRVKQATVATPQRPPHAPEHARDSLLASPEFNHDVSELFVVDRVDSKRSGASGDTQEHDREALSAEQLRETKSQASGTNSNESVKEETKSSANDSSKAASQKDSLRYPRARMPLKTSPEAPVASPVRPESTPGDVTRDVNREKDRRLPTTSLLASPSFNSDVSALPEVSFSRDTGVCKVAQSIESKTATARETRQNAVKSPKHNASSPRKGGFAVDFDESLLRSPKFDSDVSQLLSHSMLGNFGEVTAAVDGGGEATRNPSERASLVDLPGSRVRRAIQKPRAQLPKRRASKLSRPASAKGATQGPRYIAKPKSRLTKRLTRDDPSNKPKKTKASSHPHGDLVKSPGRKRGAGDPPPTPPAQSRLQKQVLNSAVEDVMRSLNEKSSKRLLLSGAEDASAASAAASTPAATATSAAASASARTAALVAGAASATAAALGTGVSTLLGSVVSSVAQGITSSLSNGGKNSGNDESPHVSSSRGPGSSDSSAGGEQSQLPAAIKTYVPGAVATDSNTVALQADASRSAEEQLATSQNLLARLDRREAQVVRDRTESWNRTPIGYERPNARVLDRTLDFGGACVQKFDSSAVSASPTLSASPQDVEAPKSEDVLMKADESQGGVPTPAPVNIFDRTLDFGIGSTAAARDGATGRSRTPVRGLIAKSDAAHVARSGALTSELVAVHSDVVGAHAANGAASKVNVFDRTLDFGGTGPAQKSSSAQTSVFDRTLDFGGTGPAQKSSSSQVGIFDRTLDFGGGNAPSRLNGAVSTLLLHNGANEGEVSTESTENSSGPHAVSCTPAQVNIFDRTLDFGGQGLVSSSALTSSAPPSDRNPSADSQSSHSVAADSRPQPGARSLFDRTLDFGGNLEAAPKTASSPTFAEQTPPRRAMISGPATPFDDKRRGGGRTRVASESVEDRSRRGAVGPPGSGSGVSPQLTPSSSASSESRGRVSNAKSEEGGAVPCDGSRVRVASQASPESAEGKLAELSSHKAAAADRRRSRRCVNESLSTSMLDAPSFASSCSELPSLGLSTLALDVTNSDSFLDASASSHSGQRRREDTASCGAERTRELSDSVLRAFLDEPPSELFFDSFSSAFSDTSLPSVFQIATPRGKKASVSTRREPEETAAPQSILKKRPSHNPETTEGGARRAPASSPVSSASSASASASDDAKSVTFRFSTSQLDNLSTISDSDLIIDSASGKPVNVRMATEDDIVPSGATGLFQVGGVPCEGREATKPAKQEQRARGNSKRSIPRPTAKLPQRVRGQRKVAHTTNDREATSKPHTVSPADSVSVETKGSSAPAGPRIHVTSRQKPPASESKRPSPTSTQPHNPSQRLSSAQPPNGENERPSVSHALKSKKERVSSTQPPHSNEHPSPPSAQPPPRDECESPSLPHVLKPENRRPSLSQPPPKAEAAVDVVQSLMERLKLGKKTSTLAEQYAARRSKSRMTLDRRIASKSPFGAQTSSAEREKSGSVTGSLLPTKPRARPLSSVMAPPHQGQDRDGRSEPSLPRRPGSACAGASLAARDPSDRLRDHAKPSLRDLEAPPQHCTTTSSGPQAFAPSASAACDAPPASTASDAPPASIASDAPPASIVSDAPPVLTASDAPPVSTAPDAPSPIARDAEIASQQHKANKGDDGATYCLPQPTPLKGFTSLSQMADDYSFLEPNYVETDLKESYTPLASVTNTAGSTTSSSTGSISDLSSLPRSTGAVEPAAVVSTDKVAESPRVLCDNSLILNTQKRRADADSSSRISVVNPSCNRPARDTAKLSSKPPTGVSLNSPKGGDDFPVPSLPTARVARESSRQRPTTEDDEPPQPEPRGAAAGGGGGGGGGRRRLSHVETQIERALTLLAKSNSLEEVTQACKLLEDLCRRHESCCWFMLESRGQEKLLVLIMSLKRSKEHIRLVQLCLDIFSHLLRVFRYEQEHAAAAASATQRENHPAVLEHSLINQAVIPQRTPTVSFSQSFAELPTAPAHQVSPQNPLVTPRAQAARRTSSSSASSASSAPPRPRPLTLLFAPFEVSVQAFCEALTVYRDKWQIFHRVCQILITAVKHVPGFAEEFIRDGHRVKRLRSMTSAFTQMHSQMVLNNNAVRDLGKPPNRKRLSDTKRLQKIVESTAYLCGIVEKARRRRKA